MDKAKWPRKSSKDTFQGQMDSKTCFQVSIWVSACIVLSACIQLVSVPFMVILAFWLWMVCERFSMLFDGTWSHGSRSFAASGCLKIQAEYKQRAQYKQRAKWTAKNRFCCPFGLEKCLWTLFEAIWLCTTLLKFCLYSITKARTVGPNKAFKRLHEALRLES